MQFLDDYVVIKEALGNLDVAEMDTLKRGNAVSKTQPCVHFFILEQISVIFQIASQS